MTAIDGATLPPLASPQPADAARPDTLTAFDAEFVVEWQVAEVSPVTHAAPENQTLFWS